jgi:anaerobic ribonucleoside-triphosphate reductase
LGSRESQEVECVKLEDRERTECEIWCRCMGYHRPTSFWNPGKQQEHRDRKFFREDKTRQSLATPERNL